MRRAHVLLVPIALATGACTAKMVAGGQPFADAGSIALADAGPLPDCMAGLPDAGPLRPVWTYASSDPNATLIFDGVSDGNGNLYWAECDGSCQLVSATRDGVIRFRVGLGSQLEGHVVLAGGHLLVAADCSVEAFDTEGQPQWTLDLTSGLGSTCAHAEVSFAELSDGKVLVMAQADGHVANPYALTLGPSGHALPWSGPARMAIASDGQGSVFLSGTRDGGATLATDERGDILWQVSGGGDDVMASGNAAFAGAQELSASDGGLLLALPATDDYLASFLAVGPGLIAASLAPENRCLYLPSCTSTALFRTGSTPTEGYERRYAGSEALLTNHDAILFVENVSTLVEADASSARFSCELALGDPGGYPHYRMALLPNRLVVAQPQMMAGPDGQSPIKLFAFDVPGLELAARGWVTPEGNPGRARRPR